MSNVHQYRFILVLLAIFIIPIAVAMRSVRYKKQYGKPGVEIFRAIEILEKNQPEGDLIQKFSFGKAIIWKQLSIAAFGMMLFLYIVGGLELGFNMTLLGTMVFLGLVGWVFSSYIILSSYIPNKYELYTDGIKLAGGTYFSIEEIFINNSCLLWVGKSHMKMHFRIASNIPIVVFCPDRIVAFNWCSIIFSHDKYIFGLNICAPKQFIQKLLNQYPLLAQKSLDEVLQIQSNQVS